MKVWITVAVVFALAVTPQFLFAGSGSQKTQADLNLDFTLPAPTAPTHKAYLGLTSNQPFTLDQIKSDILLIEIFSMYCPICQREAPKVNTLYQRIAENKDKSIRLIAIGAGNSDFETNYFKETYAIEFPLFSDGKFIIHKKVGEKGTPFFIGMNPSAPKNERIFFTHTGEIKDMDQFLNKLLKASK